MVDQMAKKLEEAQRMAIAITPEGTRSPNRDWKKGVYFIACKANVPIVLIGIDYERKTIYAERTFTPTGDVERDIDEMKHYFTRYKGKRPENYVV